MEETTKKSKKVLIADDDEGMRESLAQQLRPQGITVVTATTGDEALSMAFSEHPDLIVLDVSMPGKMGTEVLQELREDEWGKHATVVMASNVNSVDIYNQSLAAGANDFYSKAEVSLEDMAKFVLERLK